MPSNTRRIFVAFLLGVVVGLFLLGFFWPSSPRETHTAFPSPKLEQAKFVESERYYRHQFDSLDQVNQNLQTTINKTKVSLVRVNIRNRSLQGTIKDLLTIHYTSTDTVIRLDNCDSLAAAADSLLVQEAVKDSLYTDLTNIFQEQVALRDSTILLQDAQYDSLRSAHQKLLMTEDALLRENAVQQKTIRKQKRGKGVLATICLAVAGLFLYSAVK